MTNEQDSASGTAEPRPSGGFRHFIHEYRRPLMLLLVAGFAVIFIFAVLPQLAGFGRTLHRLRYGNKEWLAAGVGLESISLAGYMALLRTFFSCDGVSLGWRSSYQITMAGAVATKLLAAGGAGGIALTVWALRAAGLSAGAIARRMTSFEILLYAVFMSALVLFGGGLAVGLFAGQSPALLTVLPALFGLAVILLAVTLGFAAEAAERWLARLQLRVRRGARVVGRLRALPQTLHGGMRATIEILGHPRPGIAGAVVYWAFDIATLWCGFKAFGASPQLAPLVLGYYIGQLANALPLPGGIGGVEGGMIGSFIAFGVNGNTAVLAVLAYRLISFWLPILPGSVAYLRLRALVARWRAEAADDDDSAQDPQAAAASS